MKAQPTLYGPWDYSKAKEPYPYGNTPSYPLAGAWVSGYGIVEDWGCGAGWMEQHIDGPYVGVDGAWSRFADIQADLRTYRSNTDCVVMRHVLEHNLFWRDIATNFHASWTKRAALVLFIPPQIEDTDVGGPEWPVPDIAISGPDLMRILDDGDTQIQYVPLYYPDATDAQWAWEGVVLMSR
jgi:hypothetical protein